MASRSVAAAGAAATPCSLQHAARMHACTLARQNFRVIGLTGSQDPGGHTVRYRYSFSPQWESVGPLSLKHSGPQWESIV